MTKALAELSSLAGPVQHAHTHVQKRTGRISHFQEGGVSGIVSSVGPVQHAHTRVQKHTGRGSHFQEEGVIGNSATRTRTRVARVRAEYPSQLDYSGSCSIANGGSQKPRDPPTHTHTQEQRECSGWTCPKRQLRVDWIWKQEIARLAST